MRPDHNEPVIEAKDGCANCDFGPVVQCDGPWTQDHLACLRAGKVKKFRFTGGSVSNLGSFSDCSPSYNTLKDSRLETKAQAPHVHLEALSSYVPRTVRDRDEAVGISL
ncbi:hypothetical protein M378DRAFT_19329 [Amanita muscaria Koide BX008]|uniref:Uncharacterized protein n=1 Tax=Amanita muscaria (strain Koide BX008) TaxID=946122 RepID=A0A0C2RUS6_AMAMK|nr:hypothetical protein M378DRAFT_19329 [Amanita muscaria Koide BX008]